MGLDMYLKAEKYISGYSEPGKKTYGKIVRAAGFKLSEMDKYTPSLTVQFTIMYWRKANQIHSWFVQNVQNGVDECQLSLVSRQQLTALRDLCVEAIKTKNSSLLEPRSGFFFGSTDIDEYYWADLKNTATKLTRILDNKKFEGCDFYYRSSW